MDAKTACSSTGTKLAFGALICWIVFILVASFLPVRSVTPGDFPMSDRHFMLHAFAYFVLGVLTFAALRGLPLNTAILAAVTFLFPFSLGLAVEFLQPLAGRGWSLSDIAANGVGAAVATVLSFLLICLPGGKPAA